jgi:hypothetical protein
MTRDFHAYGPKGNLLRTFSTREQAERYRDNAAMIGLAVRIEAVKVVRRAA